MAVADWASLDLLAELQARLSDELLPLVRCAPCASLRRCGS
jgi:hypothetical protein